MTENLAGWHPDPTGRHEHRYFDGREWTEHVADKGEMSTNPIASSAPVAAPTTPSQVNLPAITPGMLTGGAGPAGPAPGGASAGGPLPGEGAPAARPAATAPTAPMSSAAPAAGVAAGGTGAMLAGIAGGLLFLDMFLSWYGVDTGGIEVGVDTTANAWQAFDFTDLILFVTSIVAIGGAFAAARMPFPAGPVVAGLGGLAALLVLYRIINQPGPNEVLTVKFGAYLGFLLACAVAFGGFMSTTAVAYKAIRRKVG